MRIIKLDAKNWKSPIDVYRAIVFAVGIPEVSNINALLEGMIWDYAFPETLARHDEMNAINPPYTIRISNTKTLSKELLAKIELIKECLTEAREEFCAKNKYILEVELEIYP